MNEKDDETAREPAPPEPREGKEFQDLGFGTKLPVSRTRLLNHDGTFNVERRGVPRHYALNFYQVLIGLNWPLFMLMVLVGYVIANTLFSCIYILIGVQHLIGHDGTSAVGNFWDAFFFSAQTLTTVGYGRIAPQGIAANMVSSLESLTGLMGFALATGLLYSRFARPQARVMFSEHVLISPYRDGTGLMFRFANARSNQLIETEVLMNISIIGADGVRRFQDLNLERKKIHFFPLSWTIVHPIEPDSPLYGMTAEDFKNGDGEFFVQIKAFDDTFAQTIYIRNSYRFDEVVYGAKFAFIFGRSESGSTTIDLGRLDEHDPVVLPATVMADKTAKAEKTGKEK
jgi:inward rectifier potassium channel